MSRRGSNYWNVSAPKVIQKAAAESRRLNLFGELGEAQARCKTRGSTGRKEKD